MTTKPTKSNRRHSKKRNVGLMYQFLVRHVTEAALRGDEHVAAKCTAIIKKHFGRGTELYREWRLFNAVVKTNGLSDVAARAVLRETRNAAANVDVKVLDDEKLKLIDVVNRELGRSTFEHVVPTYRTYATIQTLFNDWRSAAPHIVRIVDYEGKLVEHLTTRKQVPVKKVQSSPSDDVLVVRLMTEKFNRRYASKLLPRQQEILALFTADGHTVTLTSLLESVKSDALIAASRYIDTCADAHMVAKLNEAIPIIETVDVSSDVDRAMSQCMKLCELIDELKVTGER